MKRSCARRRAACTLTRTRTTSTLSTRMSTVRVGLPVYVSAYVPVFIVCICVFVWLGSQCLASSAPLRNLLDAPTALAACCVFDLCHEYILYLYFRLCAFVYLYLYLNCASWRRRLVYWHACVYMVLCAPRWRGWWRGLCARVCVRSGATFLSADDLRINMWHLDNTETAFSARARAQACLFVAPVTARAHVCALPPPPRAMCGVRCIRRRVSAFSRAVPRPRVHTPARADVVDIKPANMEELTEVITAAEFHPSHVRACRCCCCCCICAGVCVRALSRASFCGISCMW